MTLTAADEIAASLIQGTGEMAERIRSYQWERSQLGPIDEWPAELLTVVNLMLASREIMTVFWGEDRLMLYNDAYISQLGSRHPRLGQPLREVWPDVIDQVSSRIDPAFRGGKSSYLDDLPLTVMEDGVATERFYTASFEPLWVRQGSSVSVQGVVQTAINNTAKILAERKLRASETKATLILHSIGEAVIVTDELGHVEQMNRVAEVLTGWSLDEARTRVATEVFRLRDANPLEIATTGRQLGSTLNLATESILVAKDGAERSVSVTGAPIDYVEGQPKGFVLVFRDVTQQRLDQAAKEEASAIQQFLLKLADAQRGLTSGRDIIQVASELLGKHLNAGRVGFSEAEADLKTMHFLTGWTQGTLEPLTGLVPLDHWSDSTLTDFLVGRTVVYSDVRNESRVADRVANYEEIGAISVLAVPFLRRGVWRGALYVNEPEAREWTAQEIRLVEEVARRTSEAVERAQAEEELRSLAGRLGMAQQAGQMASWEWDFVSDALVWDGGSEWTYGRPPSDMVTSGQVFSYICEPDREKVRRALLPAIAGTGVYRSEFRVIWPDGSTHWILAFGRTVWSYTGKPSGIVGININVTDQKQAEVALVQTEKLAAVGRLASTIAHEINNPLEAVTNLLYLARHSSNMAEAQPFLETADAELRRASMITNQALRFHKQATKPTLCTFKQLTHDIFKGRHSRIKNAHATIEEQDRTLRPVLSFEGEIRQILNNLITNAIDALTGTGGQLVLRGRDGMDWRSGRPGMVLTVADTGTGMSQATQKKLFDAFFTTKGVGGTGLGLWVSKEIVERHAGRLLVRSSSSGKRHGTVFSLFLPYEAAVRNVTPEDTEQLA